MSTPPNILLITTHDLGWRDLACFGHDFHRTPHLDALAAGGMRCTRAYSAAPICNPSRFAMLTGRHPARHALTGQPGYLKDPPIQRLLHPYFETAFPANTRTYAHPLRAAGYACGFGGVLGPELKDMTLEDLGFSKLAATDDASLAAAAVEFIRAHRDRPFALQVNFNQVHVPLEPEAAAAERWRKRAAAEGSRCNPDYAAVVENLDRLAGKVLGALEETALEERTLVVFASDHGGFLGYDDAPVTTNAPLREGKASLYEGGVRIPMILRWPGVIAPGHTVDAPLHQCDLAPTFLVAAGLDPESIPAVDGRNLLPTLGEAEPSPPLRPFFWHWPHYRRSMACPEATPSSAILRGAWKGIHFHEDDRFELYNLEEDPGEMRNLAERQPDKAADLYRELEAWRDLVGARRGAPNRGFSGFINPA